MAINIHHTVRLHPQTTNMSCWSAAATMLFGDRSVGPGRAALGSKGGLVFTPRNIQKFARSHGLKVYYGQSWTVAGLAGLLRSGPLWVAGLVPTGHAFVIGGMTGDGTPGKTLLKIYDPWPPGKGQIRTVVYGSWMQKYPQATSNILHR